MAKKVQSTKNKIEKKVESTKITLEVNKAVDSMFFLVLVVMIIWPEVFGKIADIAQNGNLLDQIWWSFLITVVLAVYAGIITFGSEKIKSNKKNK